MVVNKLGTYINKLMTTIVDKEQDEFVRNLAISELERLHDNVKEFLGKYNTEDEEKAKEEARVSSPSPDQGRRGRGEEEKEEEPGRSQERAIRHSGRRQEGQAAGEMEAFTVSHATPPRLRLALAASQVCCRAGSCPPTGRLKYLVDT